MSFRLISKHNIVVPKEYWRNFNNHNFDISVVQSEFSLRFCAVQAIIEEEEYFLDILSDLDRAQWQQMVTNGRNCSLAPLNKLQFYLCSPISSHFWYYLRNKTYLTNFTVTSMFIFFPTHYFHNHFMQIITNFSVPAKVHFPPSWTMRGPPESPRQASWLPSAWPAHNMSSPSSTVICFVSCHETHSSVSEILK